MAEIDGAGLEFVDFGVLWGVFCGVLWGGFFPRGFFFWCCKVLPLTVDSAYPSSTTEFSFPLVSYDIMTGWLPPPSEVGLSVLPLPCLRRAGFTGIGRPSPPLPFIGFIWFIGSPSILIGFLPCP